MENSEIQKHSSIVEERLISDDEVAELAAKQDGKCFMGEHRFDGFITVKGGEPMPLTMHGAQLVYLEPHEHVNIALCSACFSFFTQQELPLTKTDVTPLVFISGSRKAAAAGKQ